MSKHTLGLWPMGAKGATRKRMMARVEELGCTVDWTSSTTMIIDAPKYHTFNTTLTASIFIDYANLYGESWKPQAYAAAIEDMSEGIAYDPLYEGGAWWDDPDDPEVEVVRSAARTEGGAA